jgi:hypothetical protein
VTLRKKGSGPILDAHIYALNWIFPREKSTQWGQMKKGGEVSFVFLKIVFPVAKACHVYHLKRHG